MSRIKIAAVAILWLLYILLSFAAMEWGVGGGVDFDTVYYVVHNYLPYQLPYPSVIGYIGGWYYPPLLAQLVAPIAYIFDLSWATRIWYILSLVPFLFLLMRLYRYVAQKDRFLYWIFAASFVPVFEALHFGQVTVLLLVFIGFAWMAVKEGRFWVAGGLLALAAWIKVYPALLIVYFLWKGQWTVVKSALLTGIVLGLFQILISGPEIFGDFFTSLLLITDQSERAYMWKNQSIYGFASHLFENNLGLTPVFVNSTLATLTRYGITLLMIGTFFISTMRTRRNSNTQETQFDLEYSLTVMMMLLLSPWLYTASIAPAFLSFFILWIHTHDLRKRLVIAIAHVGLLINYLILPADYGVYGAIIHSIGFFALVVIWILNVALLIRSRKVAELRLIASS